MRHLTITLLACAALGGTALVAADEKKDQPSDRAQVMAFLKKHVVGKTLATPKTTIKFDDGKVEGDYEDQFTFNNFSERAEGFGFDLVTVSKESRHDLDKDGKRVVPGRDTSGNTVWRYEICERASTKKLTGTARIVSTTKKSPNQDGTVILVTGVKVVDGKLSWNETQPGYGDATAAEGKYKPESFDGKYTFSITDGKLRSEGDFTLFDVDPETLQRTPVKDKPPLLVAKEIEQK
jgi:hypothetical protein